MTNTSSAAIPTDWPARFRSATAWPMGESGKRLAERLRKPSDSWLAKDKVR
jgi:hypothetical protein